MLKIYSFVSNRPELLEHQFESFNNHLQEPFLFHVIDNSMGGSTVDVRGAVAHYRVPGPHTTDCTRSCAAGMKWAWENIISGQQCPVLIMHHDMFLIRDVKLTDYLEYVPMVFVPQSRPGVPLYIWEGFTLFDMKQIRDPEQIDWNPGTINGTLTDVGGMIHYWFKDHPDTWHLPIRPVHTEDDPNVNFHPSRYEYLYFGDETVPTVLHYRAASDWMNFGQEYHRKKFEWLKKQLC